MSKEIIVKRVGRGAYGNEYEACYLKDGKVLHKEVMLGGDLKDADRAFTKDFEGVKVQRNYNKKKIKDVS